MILLQDFRFNIIQDPGTGAELSEEEPLTEAAISIELGIKLIIPNAEI